MSLSEAIREAVEHFHDPPPNESTTCEWVIYPLLLAAGYARRDILSRTLDNNRQFPDYSLLPETPWTWFLEAKAWADSLEDRHAQQSPNYANQNGRRWVVLTNGRIWRLYDNQIQGLAPDKLVVEAFLIDEPTVTAFLQAIGKASVMAGGLERFADDEHRKRERAARRETLMAALQAQLKDENSDLITAMWKSLRRHDGLGGVSRQEIVDALHEFSIREIPPSFAAAKSSSRGAEPQPLLTRSRMLSLLQLRERPDLYVTGRKPEGIEFPDGTTVPVKTWAMLAGEVVSWLGRQNRLPPIPFQTNERNRNYFLNSTPHHKTGEMNAFIALKLNDASLYVDSNRSGDNLLQNLCAIIQTVDLSPSDFRVQLRDQAQNEDS